MTTHINFEETYNELNNLLKDVCSFINTEVQNGTLSSAATNQAKTLLHRLQQQAEVISKISALQESTNSNYPYLQMQGPTLIEEPMSEYVDAESLNHYEEEAYEETENYASIAHESVSLPPPSSLIIEDRCPFLELPLSELSETAVKCGPLLRKERYLFIEQKKHLYVGLVGYYLLIYCSNKKDKPTQVVNVTEYRAQAKKDPIFEIVSQNKKSQEFIARSAKDMDQWIVAINCKKQLNSNVRNLPAVPLPIMTKSSEEDITDFEKVSNNNLSSDSFEEQDIYENVDDLKKTEIKPAPAPTAVIEEDHEDYTPKLPERQPNYIKRFINIKNKDSSTYKNVTNDKVVESIEEEDDEENTYDPVQNGEIEEEDDDQIYDEPRMPETFNKYVKLPVPSLINQAMAKPPEINRLVQVKPPERRPTSQIHEYDIEEEEEDSYDIPRSEYFNNQSKSPTNDYEDENAEYDELVIPQNPIQIPDLKVDTTAAEKIKSKPVITSPKPKLQNRLDTLPAFSKKSENTEPQETNKTKGIHNIIQQLEQKLTFKGKN